MGTVLDGLMGFLESVGQLGLFAVRAIRESFRSPVEFGETIHQLYEIGWRSGPLVIVSGFAFGIVLALQTGAS
jgi:phospholipid/cholesterol/gamma-HCH transport system permease protein